MCLIAFGWNPSPQLRLLVVANRDEFHGRPSAPLSVWPDRPQLLAGRDLQAAGTWLGISTQGRLAAVTNVRMPAARPPARHSRGKLALDYLDSRNSPSDYLKAMQPLLPDFGPCNLLLADPQQALYASNHPAARLQKLQAGLYTLSNAALDTPWPKTRFLKSAVAHWIEQGRSDNLSPLFEALRSSTIAEDHQLPDTGIGLAGERFLSPAFIRSQDYGTRCSTVVVVDSEGRGRIQEHRFGPGGTAEGQSGFDFLWPAA